MNESNEYGRFFTATRHIPMTFGTNPATGERLPGGPYTSVQVFGGLGVGVLVWLTGSLWGTGTAIVDLVLGAGAVAAAVWGLRYMPDDLTELWALAIGASKILDAPSAGSYEGKPLKAPKTPKIPPGLNVPTLGQAPATSSVPVQDEPTEQPVPRYLGTSSVDRLLTHTTSKERTR